MWLHVGGSWKRVKKSPSFHPGIVFFFWLRRNLLHLEPPASGHTWEIGVRPRPTVLRNRHLSNRKKTDPLVVSGICWGWNPTQVMWGLFHSFPLNSASHFPNSPTVGVRSVFLASVDARKVHMKKSSPWDITYYKHIMCNFSACLCGPIHHFWNRVSSIRKKHNSPQKKHIPKGIYIFLSDKKLPMSEHFSWMQ